jgi:hypothetical protein
MSASARMLRLLGAGDDEIGDERRSLQERVRLYGKCLLGIVGGLYLLFFVLLTYRAPHEVWRSLTSPQRLAHAGAVIVIALWVLVAGRYPLRAWILHAIAPELLGLLAGAMVLVLRSAIVPSPGGSTWRRW